MDLISDNSLYHVLAHAHDQSLSLFLVATSYYYYCSALSLSQEYRSSLSLARACVGASYVLSPCLGHGVLYVLVSPCDCGAYVVICVHGSLVDTVGVVHSHEKTVKPQGETGRRNYFFPSDSRCWKRT